MGGSNEKVQISLAVDTPSVVAGGEAISFIHLVVKDDLKASQLALRFYGQECAYKEKNRVEPLQIPVHIWEDNLVPKGQYSFPIVFQVPSQVPSSFEAGQYSIKYYQEAVLLSRSGREVVADKSEIVINQEIEAERNSYQAERRLPVAGCCFSRGVLNVRVHTDKFAYLPHEAPALDLFLDNSDGVAKILQVSYSLCRLIVNRKTKHSEKLYLGDDSKNIVVGKERMEEPLRFDVALFRHFEEIQSAGTTKGTLFECKYLLEFTIRFSGCASVCTFESPLQLFSREKEARPQPSAPADWQPVEMPLSNLSFLSAVRFEPSAPVLDDDN